MSIPPVWAQILAPGPGTREFIPVSPERRIADYVAASFAQSNSVGPTEHNVRDFVFERGLHPQQFQEFLSSAVAANLVESYVDDAGTVRYRPLPE